MLTRFRYTLSDTGTVDNKSIVNLAVCATEYVVLSRISFEPNLHYIGVLSRQLRKQFDGAFKALAFTRSQWAVLLTVILHEGISQSRLSALIVDSKDQNVYNLAAQVWNHAFYWQCMRPDGGGRQPAVINALLEEHFGSIDNFNKEFTEEAKGLFGSGWIWLVRDANGALRITATGNAENPMSEGLTPLLTLNVWEHACYLDWTSRTNMDTQEPLFVRYKH